MSTLAAALVAAQKEMPAVHKSAKANYGNYATLDAIIEKTRPILNNAGLAISQFPSETSTGMPGLKTVLLHAESGEQIEATVPLLLNGKLDMQALGGAITYARRYGWAAVLGIANDEDDDGNRVSSSAGAVSGGRADTGGNGAAVRTDGNQPPAAAPQNLDGWTWPFGKHKGKPLADTPSDYLEWFLEKSDKEDIKAKVREFLNLEEAAALPGGSFYDDVDSDVPFDRSIDGLGN